MHLAVASLFLAVLSGGLLGCSQTESTQMASGTLKQQSGEQKEAVMENNTYEYGSGIPEELEYIPEGYTQPAKQQGTLEKLEYQTYESFSYEERSERLTKTA